MGGDPDDPGDGHDLRSPPEERWYDIGGANRDPEVFDDAGTLDIGRTRTST